MSSKQCACILSMHKVLLLACVIFAIQSFQSFSFKARHKSDGKLSCKQSPFLLDAYNIPPPYVQSKDGDVVPYPIGRSQPVNVKNVGSVGEKCLQLPISSYGDGRFTHGVNVAQAHYIRKRPSLLKSSFGMWVGFDVSGNMLVFSTEAELVSIAHKCGFLDDFYWDCVGCEVLEEAIMDSMNVIEGKPEDYKDVDMDVEDGFQTGIEGSALWLRGDYSEDGGVSFKPAPWLKHDTGANMVGVPERVFNSPSIIHPLWRRNGFTAYVDGSGNKKKNIVYSDFFIKVNGLITRTNVVVAPRWLLGYPIWSRYKTIIDPSDPDKYCQFLPLSSSKSDPPLFDMSRPKAEEGVV